MHPISCTDNAQALKAFVDNITPENVGLSSLRGRKRLHGTCRSSCRGRFDIKIIEQSASDMNTIKVTDRREVALRDDASKEEEVPELVRIVQRRLADVDEPQQLVQAERAAYRDVLEEDRQRLKEKAIAKASRQHTRERRAASRRWGGASSLPPDEPLNTGSNILSRAAVRKLKRSQPVQGEAKKEPSADSLESDSSDSGSQTCESSDISDADSSDAEHTSEEVTEEQEGKKSEQA